MKHIKQKAFTLVELVVVATILAILGAVGFSAYTGYISGARDSNRIAQLASIHDGLNILTAKSSLPIPDDSIEVEINGEHVAYQGYAGANTLETIGYKKGGKDPKDDQYFSYYLDKKRNSLQLMAFLEDQDSVTTAFNFGKNVSANTYLDRIPSLYGKEMGILTDDNNTPIQDIPTLISAGNINITSGTTGYVSHLSESEKLSGTELIKLNPNLDCKRIKNINGGSQSGVYTINPNGGSAFPVYCDMDTNNGGWTMTSMLAESTTRNLFETGTSDTIVYPEGNISTKGNITEIWLSGEKKDIMIQCYTEAENFQSYTKPIFIYDFLFSDIGNLTKYTKANTAFSSIELEGEYDGKKIQYVKNFTGGSGPSMYLYGTLDDEGPGRLFQLASSSRMYRSSAGVVGAAGYSNTGSSSNYFDSDVYCITAIR